MTEQRAGEDRTNSNGNAPCSSKKQTAILFGLLLSLQFAVAALTPVGGPHWNWSSQALFGASLACPPLLAVWAVFGPQHALVRLSLALWLALAIGAAAAYGMNCNEGRPSEFLLLFSAAWVVALGAFQTLLWSVRAIRRWRLERVPPRQVTVAEGAGQPASTSSRQFSLRALLGWILAAAVLLGAFRAMAPTFDLEAEELEQLSVEAAQISLLFILEGLPVIALAWIVLVDGRRRTLRCVLSLLILLSLAALYGIADEMDVFPNPRETLECGAGALLNGLVCVCALRTCGYRLRRRKKTDGRSAAEYVAAPVSRTRFAIAAAPIVIALAAAGCSVPFRLEHWRQAKIGADWAHDGITVVFDGGIKKLLFHRTAISDEICRRIASVANLASLDLTTTPITDRQLALLAPLTRLTKLTLSSTAITDEGLKCLAQFPQLHFLDLTATQITDAGLVHLTALPELRRLQLCLTDISEESLQTLGELPSLQYLDVSLTAIGAEATKEFRRLHPTCNICCGATDGRLRVLTITQRTEYFTETGFEFMGIGSDSIRLKRLHARGAFCVNGVGAALSHEERAYFAARQAEWKNWGLPMGGTGSYEFNRGANAAVTEAGLAFLVNDQADLEELDLRDSAVTDQGLWELRVLPKLKRLDVRGAPITEQGVARLASALPDCEIIR